MKRFYLAILLSVVSVGALAAIGDPGQNDKPVEITANSLEVLQAERKAIFKGAVKAVQGDVTLSADEMTVFYKKSGGGNDSAGGFGAVSRIEASGNAHLTTPEETASGDKGVYEVDQKKVHLLGNVELTRDKNILRGTRLEYSFVTGRSLVTSNGKAGEASGGRVRAIFVPKDGK